MKTNKKGFTLIEIIVTMAVLAITFTMAVSLFLNIYKTRVRTRAISQIKQSGNYAIDFVARNVRNAVSMTETVSPQSINLLDKNGDAHIIDCENGLQYDNVDLTYDTGPGEISISACYLDYMQGNSQRPPSLSFGFTLSMSSIYEEVFSANVSLRNKNTD